MVTIERDSGDPLPYEGVWRFTAPAVDASVPQARHAVRDLLLRQGVPVADEVVQGLLLIVSELVTNAVRHGSGPVTLHLTDGSYGLQIEVDDDGPGQPVLLDQDPLTPGGQGLHLVEALSARWGVDRHALGKTVWFRVR